MRIEVFRLPESENSNDMIKLQGRAFTLHPRGKV